MAKYQAQGLTTRNKWLPSVAIGTQGDTDRADVNGIYYHLVN